MTCLSQNLGNSIFKNNFLDHTTFPFTEFKREKNGCNLNKTLEKKTKKHKQSLNNKNLDIKKKSI